jgi:uncharacterized protein (TIGR00251 family)
LAAHWYQWDGEDLTLAVYVQPRASRDSIEGTHGERLKIRLMAPPVEGRANEHLLRFLASVFGVPRRQVTLLAGTNGRNKRIRIERPSRLPDGLLVAPPAAGH